MDQSRAPLRGSSKLAVLAAMTAALALGCVAPASASVVIQDTALSAPPINYYRLHESNDVQNSVSVSVSGSNYVVTDAAGIAAGTGCAQVTPTQATCPTSWSNEWEAEVGSLNDSVAFDLAAGSFARIEAGEGDDLMSGGREGNFFDGSGGFDTVDYSASPRVATTTGSGFGTGVTADLSTGFGAGAGTDAEGDAYLLVDRVRGSAFGDVLTGGPDPETLVGGAGRDSLTGNGGIDKLLGGDANDRQFSAADGAVDVNKCGAGKRDRVERDSTDSAKGCEVRLG